MLRASQGASHGSRWRESVWLHVAISLQPAHHRIPFAWSERSLFTCQGSYSFRSLSLPVSVQCGNDKRSYSLMFPYSSLPFPPSPCCAPQAGRLKVRFPFVPVLAPYNIIRLDGVAATGYDKAVVYSCSGGQVRRRQQVQRPAMPVSHFCVSAQCAVQCTRARARGQF